MGLAAVEAKVNAPLAPIKEPEPEKDDGHIETVEEVKMKMAAAQAAMDEGINNVDHKADERAKMDDVNFGALGQMGGSLTRMTSSKKTR